MKSINNFSRQATFLEQTPQIVILSQQLSGHDCTLIVRKIYVSYHLRIVLDKDFTRALSTNVSFRPAGVFNHFITLFCAQSSVCWKFTSRKVSISVSRSSSLIRLPMSKFWTGCDEQIVASGKSLDQISEVRHNRRHLLCSISLKNLNLGLWFDYCQGGISHLQNHYTYRTRPSEGSAIHSFYSLVTNLSKY